jgi:molecular chaperone GrpE
MNDPQANEASDLPEDETDVAAQARGANAATEAEPDISQVRAELADSRDKLLRLQAEMENLRRRTRREIEDERKYANLPLMRDLLPVIDNVGRALEAADQSQDVAALIAGMKLIAQQLQAVLAQHGGTQIEAEQREFDPNVHEAILQQPSADHPPNTVMLVTQTGYKLHDRVIRPSQVIVSRAP